MSAEDPWTHSHVLKHLHPTQGEPRIQPSKQLHCGLWCSTLSAPPPLPNERPGQWFKMTNNVNRKLHGMRVIFRIHAQKNKKHSTVKHKGIQ